LATLRYDGPDGETKHFDLNQTSTVIGRETRAGGNADIEIAGDDVSRTHATILREGDCWFLVDDTSRNHTLVNGIDITGRGRRRLRDGAEIRIRQHRFVFEDPDSANASSIQILSDDDSSDMFPSSSISLERLSQIRDQGDASRRLAALIQISRSLQRTLMLDDVLASTLDELFKILPAADRGCIGTVSENGTIEANWGRYRNHNESQKDVEVSLTIVNRVLSSKEALLLDKETTTLPATDSVYILPLGSVICAPLLDPDGNANGFLQLDTSQSDGFGAKDLELVAAVAVQVSLAINMARLHETSVQQQVLLRDVENARAVQQNFLPQSSPPVPGYEFAHFYEPAKLIGGDYFDFVDLRNGRQAVVLADVGGKGVPAALYMAKLATETRSLLQRFDDATRVISELNRSLKTCFVTFALAVLDPVSHEVTVVNAGHRAPILRRNDGAIQSAGDEIVGLPFSVLEDNEYESATVSLRPGESIVMCSDGFEDALKKSPVERFGIKRIRAAIQSCDGTAADIRDLIVNGVSDFTGDTPQFDDMCLVVFRRETTD